MKKREFGFIFWVHLILIILVWTSPFWLNWKLIFLFIVLYYIQLIIFKDCILTKKQFKTKTRSTTFYYYYLTKIGFKLKIEKVRKFVDYYAPWIIFSFALILQEVLKLNPKF